MRDKLDLRRIATEQRNPRTAHIDELPTIEMVRLINSEDKKVAEAVELVCPQIAEAIDLIYSRLRDGGRLVYCGCGTSGRLGVLDAVECPPTYSVDPDFVRGIIAGGYSAVFKAVEGAEDKRELGEQELRDAGFGAKDVLGAMEYARSIGAAVIGLTCCPSSEIDRIADVGIAPAPGPEVITGSTRMKSGTAQKMVLNMLSTGTMIKLGKVYGNLMVDVKPSNEKLVRRCVTIVCEATGVGEDEAVAALEKCGYVCKQAIVMLLRGVDAPRAAEMLNAAGGRVAAALEEK